MQKTAFIQALLSAVLFGVSAPLAKLLLADFGPLTLAGLLYLGAGVGLLLTGMVIYRYNHHKGIYNAEAPLREADYTWLLGAVLAGGVAAPILLLYSLRLTPAATASLLLGFEGAATALIARLLFGESLGRRAWGAIGLVTLAGVLLSYDPSAAWGISWGALGVLGACVLWGLDNNLIRQISAKNPLGIAMGKGLAAAGCSLLLVRWFEGPWPDLCAQMPALLLGYLSYGLSIVLFVRALRSLGAARTSILFSTAPLAGVLLSAALFREMPGWLFFLALPLMGAGIYLLANEEHIHPHLHPTETHEHRHAHGPARSGELLDEHHQHGHPAGQPEAQAHAHPHTHQPLEHDHEHRPDLHHRHPDED